MNAVLLTSMTVKETIVQITKQQIKLCQLKNCTDDRLYNSDMFIKGCKDKEASESIKDTNSNERAITLSLHNVKEHLN